MEMLYVTYNIKGSYYRKRKMRSESYLVTFYTQNQYGTCYIVNMKF